MCREGIAGRRDWRRARLARTLPFMASLSTSVLRLAVLPLRIADGVAALPDIQRDVRRMADATAALPEVLEQLRVVARSTEAMPELDRRVADIQGALPALIELERSLPALTPAIVMLGESLERLL